MLQKRSHWIVGLRRMITGGILVMFCCTVGAADRSHKDVAKVRQLREDLGGSQANPENRSLWGALAIDANQGQRWGWAIDYATVQEAKQRALSECGGNCRVVMTFRDQCGAYAADEKRGSTIYGWGKDGTSTAARNRALNECRNRGGKSCIVRVWGCTRR